LTTQTASDSVSHQHTWRNTPNRSRVYLHTQKPRRFRYRNKWGM